MIRQIRQRPMVDTPANVDYRVSRGELHVHNGTVFLDTELILGVDNGEPMMADDVKVLLCATCYVADAEQNLQRVCLNLKLAGEQLETVEVSQMITPSARRVLRQSATS